MHDQNDLPRVAIIGEVPPESTTGGDLLLYRLLAEYPPERLLVIHSPLSTNNVQQRLSNVRYECCHYLPLPRRLYATRFASALAAVTAYTSNRSSKKLGCRLREFGAEVVITISQGFQWLLAVRTATHFGIPSILICHDDWVQTTNAPTWINPRLDKIFGDAYRSATTRLAVCPYMAELYECDYGAGAEVLWPSRGIEILAPVTRIHVPGKKFVVAFAGSLFRDSRSHLGLLAQALGDEGEVHVYTPQELGELQAYRNVRHCGFVTPAELAKRVTSTADALFLSMQFQEEVRRTSMTSFPSKIAEYTAMGLPLLILGPEYCSAVRWARESSSSAFVVTEPSVDALNAVIGQIRDNDELRNGVAERAAVVGNAMFGPETVRNQFLSYIKSVSNR